jgi:purine-binding chemotaxis protein CheW
MNLRGKVIPIISLRKRLGLEDRDHAEQTRIVVLEAGGMLIGFIVDSVSEVLRIPVSLVTPVPRIGSVEREFVSGIGKLDDRLVLLLDVDRIALGAEAELAATAGA